MRPAVVDRWVAACLQARADRAGRLVAGQQALAGGHHGGGGGAQLLGVLAIVDRRSVGRAHCEGGAAANGRWGRAEVERERGADEGEHGRRTNGKKGTGITWDADELRTWVPLGENTGRPSGRGAPRLRRKPECVVCVVARVRGEVCVGTLARRTPPN